MRLLHPIVYQISDSEHADLIFDMYENKYLIYFNLLSFNKLISILKIISRGICKWLYISVLVITFLVKIKTKCQSAWLVIRPLTNPHFFISDQRNFLQKIDLFHWLNLSFPVRICKRTQKKYYFKSWPGMDADHFICHLAKC